MPIRMRSVFESFTWLAAGILLAVLTIPAGAQPLQCANVTGVPPIVRAEGTAELMGDLVLDCTGGTPTPPGQRIQEVNIAVNLDTDMSSKVTAVANNSVEFLEALLIVDEPASVTNPTVPILNCGNIGAPDNTQAGTGVCEILGGGSNGAAATYNGTPGHPNVFQGRSFSLITGQQNQVVFAGIPIDPPGMVCPNQSTQPVCHRILRITNTRGNATVFGVSGNNVASVHAQIIVNPFVGLPIDNPVSVVARVQQGLISSVGTFAVRLQEAYLDSWKPKNIALSLTNGTVFPQYSYLGGTSYALDAAQNVAGFDYNAESGFQWQNNSPNGPPSPNPPFGPSVPNEGNPLHSAGLGGFDTGIASAGVADAGTRLALRFNIPPGASVVIPSVVQLHNVINNEVTGVMALTSTDSAGAGPFSPGIGTLPNGSSSNLAVYEILFANPGALEYAFVEFALYFAPPDTTAPVTTAFAPFYSGAAANQASSTYPVPRFGVIPVGIDIKPGAFPNTINLKSGGAVLVAILSTPSFDARDVNPLTITLAGAIVKANPKGTPNFSFQDVNGDGLLDLVVHISIDELQLSSTNTQAILTGQTFDGQLIRGADSVKLTH